MKDYRRRNINDYVGRYYDIIEARLEHEVGGELWDMIPDHVLYELIEGIALERAYTGATLSDAITVCLEHYKKYSSIAGYIRNQELEIIAMTYEKVLVGYRGLFKVCDITYSDDMEQECFKFSEGEYYMDEFIRYGTMWS